jgi:DNA-binding FadR family transcriptional regulator
VPARSQAHHRLIFESILRGDAAAARRAMWQHTQQVAEDIEATINAHTIEENQIPFNPSLDGQ